MLSKFKRRLEALPLVRQQIRRTRYQKFLRSDGYACYGVFATFEQARKILPKSPEFNSRDLAEEYAEVRMHRNFAYDYPVVYWLSNAFRQRAKTVFDIGGSVGVHFYAYQKIMSYPAGLRWTVCETPQIVAVGREIALQTPGAGLSFTDTLHSAYLDSDIWISAGALQYIEHGQISSLLAACERKPVHIILNKLPMYDGDDFVSTQNLGKECYAPFYVYNKRRFIGNVIALGYEVVDTWSVPERDLYLPGHSERSFSSFTGIYFRLKT